MKDNAWRPEFPWRHAKSCSSGVLAWLPNHLLVSPSDSDVSQHGELLVCVVEVNQCHGYKLGVHIDGP